ncbi:MAG: hypothetical protein D6785_02230 [Planctomycetota bacterium]|nr:MAG: hypothetical protein D6785_02230 [Planctomycetota bacterium]
MIRKGLSLEIPQSKDFNNFILKKSRKNTCYFGIAIPHLPNKANQIFIPPLPSFVYSLQGRAKAMTLPSIQNIHIPLSPFQEVLPNPWGKTYPAFLFGKNQDKKELLMDLERGMEELHFFILPKGYSKKEKNILPPLYLLPLAEELWINTHTFRLGQEENQKYAYQIFYFPQGGNPQWLGFTGWEESSFHVYWKVLEGGDLKSNSYLEREIGLEWRGNMKRKKKEVSLRILDSILEKVPERKIYPITESMDFWVVKSLIQGQKKPKILWLHKNTPCSGREVWTKIWRILFAE